MKKINALKLYTLDGKEFTSRDYVFINDQVKIYLDLDVVKEEDVEIFRSSHANLTKDSTIVIELTGPIKFPPMISRVLSYTWNKNKYCRTGLYSYILEIKCQIVLEKSHV
jgi:hypothetical protein